MEKAEEGRWWNMKNRFWIGTINLILILVITNSSYGTLFPVTGNSTGIFTDPTGPAGMITSGVNTNHFTWGEPIILDTSPNKLDYTGTSFSSSSDTAFSFGTLTYYNSMTSVSTTAESVNMTISLTFETPSGIQQGYTYNFGLDILNTPNAGGNVNDTVSLPSTMPDLYFTDGDIDYKFEFLGFGIQTESGFNKINSFDLDEGSQTSAQLLGKIIVVPEPATLLLFITGSIHLGLIKKRRIKFVWFPLLEPQDTSLSSIHPPNA